MTEISEETSTKIEEYLSRWMACNGTPGISMAITDRDKTIGTFCAGEADISRKRPVSPNTPFQIGSVSKSFTCIAILQLAEKGMIDINEKITKYLPWFKTRSGHEEITIHHLMTHTSGLMIGSDTLPTAESEVWSLRFADSTSPKGSYFHYSNSAYKALGVMLETVTGRGYDTILNDSILRPLAMDSTEPVICNSSRRRLAIGYTPLHDDRPFIRGDELEPATWFESNTADGSICSTGTDMCIYMRMLLNQGKHPQGRILSDDAFRKMTSPFVDTNDGVHGRNYGYGLNIEEIDGNLCLGHQGGMVGHYTSMLMDTVNGIGVMVMINGPGEPYEVAKMALRIVGSNRDADSPVPKDPVKIGNSSDWSGTFTSKDGTIEFVTRDGEVFLKSDQEEHRMVEIDAGAIYANTKKTELFPFRLVRRDGKVVGVVHGPSEYSKVGEEMSSGITLREEWKAYPGHYRTHNPWLNNFRIVLRQSGLVMISPSGQEEPLILLDNGEFRIGADPRSPERISFDAIVEGKAMIANMWSGGMYGRTFTP